MNKYKELQQKLASVEEDAKKFYDSGNKAAGTRLRKAMMELKNMAQDIRTEVSELKRKKLNASFSFIKNYHATLLCHSAILIQVANSTSFYKKLA